MQQKVCCSMVATQTKMLLRQMPEQVGDPPENSGSETLAVTQSRQALAGGIPLFPSRASSPIQI